MFKKCQLNYFNIVCFYFLKVKKCFVKKKYVMRKYVIVMQQLGSVRNITQL